MARWGGVGGSGTGGGGEEMGSGAGGGGEQLRSGDWGARGRREEPVRRTPELRPGEWRGREAAGNGGSSVENAAR